MQHQLTLKTLNKGLRLSLVLAINGLISQAAWALVKQDILFYLPLDGNLAASIARGNPDPLAPADVKFVQGYKGQGVLVGNKGGEIIYATKDNLQTKAGAISMWLKPVGWGGGEDSYMRFFFRVSDAQNTNDFLWLYKFFQNPVYWLAQKNEPTQKVYLLFPTGGDIAGLISYAWEDGKWANIIACWSGNQMSLYINGQYAGATYVPGAGILQKFGPQFIVGGQNTHNGGTPDMVIDEVIVFNRSLASNEVAAVCQSGIAAAQANLVPQPMFNISAGYNSAHGKIFFTDEVVGLGLDELQDTTLNYEVTDSDNKSCLQGKLGLNSLKESRHIDVRTLPIGKYRVQAELIRRGAVIGRAQSAFQKQARPEWLDNQIGVSPKVLPPWTPIALTGGNLSCWGRFYNWCKGSIFASQITTQSTDVALSCWGRLYNWDQAGIFPSQITAQGQKLLLRPITISAVVNGRACAIENAKVSWNKIQPACVEYTAKGFLGGIPVKVSGRVEYDGFIWITFNLDPGKSGSKFSIESLSMEIPLRREVATLMCGRPPVPGSGNVRPFSGSFDNTPVVWLGNEIAGLQWSTDQFKDWQLTDRNNMAALQVDDSAVVLRLNMINKPVKMDKVLNYSVGLQATPVKPMCKDFRAWEMKLNNINCSKANGRTAWAFYRTDWNRMDDQNKFSDGPFSYMYASRNTYQLSAEYKSQNIIPWIYWNMHMLWCGDPVLANFPEWGEFKPGGAEVHPYSGIRADHNNKEQSDYSLWMNWNLLKDGRVSKCFRGFYIDTAQAGWDNGIYTVIGTRNLQKRFYTMLKENWPDGLVANHQSGDLNMSQLAFADAMVTGENFAANPILIRDLNYYHLLTLDAMRAEYCGRNVGLPMIFLPELARSVGSDPVAREKILSSAGIPAAEHLAGMLWLHDVIPWYTDINTAPLKQAARAKDAFGWDGDTEFVGYWSNNGYISTIADKDPVVVTIYLRKGKVLFVVMNNSDEAAQVEIKPNWAKLGIVAPEKLVDAYLEQAEVKVASSALFLPVSDGKIKFAVKARNFRALAVR